MFSPQIVASDEFLGMPVSSQALYFHLGMNADDDGFIQPRIIMRTVGAADDDLKVLLAKRFLLPFESGVVVIKHWLIHNLIQKDRYHPTRFQEEKNLLLIKENKAYTENPNPVNKMLPQVRLGKVSITVADAPEPLSLKRKKMKKNRLGAYDESKSSDEFESVIDADTNDTPTLPRKATKESASASYMEMIIWAQRRRGFNFVNAPKQFKAFSRAKEAEILPSKLKERWIEMETDPFWSKNGFDWLNVVDSFDKKG